MTTSTAPDPGSSQTSLELFCARVRDINPFQMNRVVQPSTTDLDATTVHEAAYQQLVSLARQSLEQRIGIGALLWGEAGVGKSHLLSRLSRWAGRDREACFVYLQNLQASPDALPRSLLKSTVSILTHGRRDRWHETTLYRLVNAALKEALRLHGVDKASLPEIEHAYERLIDQLSEAVPSRAALVDRTAYDVLFRFFRSAYLAREDPDQGGTAGLAVRWLAGDALDRDEARALGLPPSSERDDVVALADDQQIKLVLIALCQVALFRNYPFVLCFDQVEGVEAEQMSALARFLQAVLDSAPNLLVVTCGAYERLLHWQGDRIISSAAWDRIAQYEITLGRVSAAEGLQIVQVRLEEFIAPWLGLAAVREKVERDALFPLGRAWFEQFLKDKVDVRPRDVITWAREGWSREQVAQRSEGDAAWMLKWGSNRQVDAEEELTTEQELERIDRKVGDKLEEQIAQRRLDPQSLPPDADNLAGLVQALLTQCRGDGRPPRLTGVERGPRSRGQRPALDLTVQVAGNDGNHRSIGVLFVATASASSATASLRKLAQMGKKPDRLLVVVDERLPLKLGTKGEEYLQSLRQALGSRFDVVRLAFDQVAALDALQMVLAMARSGDLEIELPRGRVRRVEEREVLDSNRRQDRYAAHPLLARFLREMPAETPASVAAAPDVHANDIRQVIMGRLAMMPGATSHELALHCVEFLKTTRQVTVDPTKCKQEVETIARTLHKEGKLNATPIEDGLYLLPRRRE